MDKKRPREYLKEYKEVKRIRRIRKARKKFNKARKKAHDKRFMEYVERFRPRKDAYGNYIDVHGNAYAKTDDGKSLSSTHFSGESYVIDLHPNQAVYFQSNPDDPEYVNLHMSQNSQNVVLPVAFPQNREDVYANNIYNIENQEEEKEEGILQEVMEGRDENGRRIDPYDEQANDVYELPYNESDEDEEVPNIRGRGGHVQYGNYESKEFNRAKKEANDKLKAVNKMIVVINRQRVLENKQLKKDYKAIPRHERLNIPPPLLKDMINKFAYIREFWKDSREPFQEPFPGFNNASVERIVHDLINHQDGVVQEYHSQHSQEDEGENLEAVLQEENIPSQNSLLGGNNSQSQPSFIGSENYGDLFDNMGSFPSEHGLEDTPQSQPSIIEQQDILNDAVVIPEVEFVYIPPEYQAIDLEHEQMIEGLHGDGIAEEHKEAHYDNLYDNARLFNGMIGQGAQVDIRPAGINYNYNNPETESFEEDVYGVLTRVARRRR